VDAHTHLVFAGTRANEFEMRALGSRYEEIAAAGGGIRSTIEATRRATEEELVLAGLRHAGWMIRCGTTTAEAKSGYGQTLEDELKILRAVRRIGERCPLRILPTFLGAHAAPGDPEAYVDDVIGQMLPEVVRRGLAEFCDAFCEPGYFSVKECRRLLLAARARGLGVRIHADQLSDSGGARLAAEIGAMTADHLEHTGSDGIAALAGAAVQPVLLPGSVHGLGKDRYPAAREMIGAGLAVVLATDFNPGSSPTPSLPMVMNLACLRMGLTPAEALVACTVNAAHSLGRGSETGSLEIGKLADFVIWDCEDWREVACFFGVELVRAVFVGGRHAFLR
jgi:imidazolonepropionase